MNRLPNRSSSRLFVVMLGGLMAAMGCGFIVLVFAVRAGQERLSANAAFRPN